MNRRLRALAARLGRPLLAPVRAQMFAWIDYRIGLAPGRVLATHAEGGTAEVTFHDVVPALLAAISSANATVREARRREVALTERVDALEAELHALRVPGKRGGWDETLHAA